MTNIRLLFLHLLVESNSDVFYYVVAHSFKTFAVRMQTRSGMTALDDTWCDENPLSCGVIQVTCYLKIQVNTGPKLTRPLVCVRFAESA